MVQRLFGRDLTANIQSPEQLQPAPIQSSTYVRPAQRETGRNAAALADALSSLNRALRQYGSISATLRDDQNSADNKAAADRFTTMTVEQLQSLDWKRLPRAQQDAASAVLGGKVAADFRAETAEWLATELPAGADAMSEIEARRRAVLERLPNDAARAMFWKSTQQWAESLNNQFIDQRIKQAFAARDDAIIGNFANIVDDGISAGKAPEQIAQEVFAFSRESREFQLLSGADQNATLFNLAARYAAMGRPDIVRALGWEKRGDTPALVGTSQYGSRLYDLLEQAENVRDREAGERDFEVRAFWDNRASIGAVNEQDAARIAEQYPHLKAQALQWLKTATIVRQKQAAKRAELEAEREVLNRATQSLSQVSGADRIVDVEIPTASGGTRKITREEQIQHAVRRNLQAIEDAADAAVKKGSLPAAERDNWVFAQKLHYATQTKQILPEWENMLNNVELLAAPQLIASGADIPPELIERVELYRKIAANDRAYALRLVKDDKTRTFLDTYATAREIGGAGGAFNTRQALFQAARVANMTEAERERSLPIKYEDINKAVDKAASSLLSEDGDPTAFDYGRGLEIAKQLALAGVPAADLPEKIKERMKATSVVINGRLVPITDRNIPPDFKDLVEDYLDKYAEEMAERDGETGITSGDDLYIMPLDADTWAIMRKDGGILGAAPTATIDLADLNRMRKEREDEKRREEAAWGMSRDEQGLVKTVVKWAFGKLSVEGVSQEQAETYLADRKRRRLIESYIAGDARRKGYNQARTRGGKVWVDRSGRILEPEVHWSDSAERSLEWKRTGRRWTPTTE